MLGVDDGGTGARCGVCSNLAKKTPERHHWRRAGIFIVKFGHDWSLFCVSVVGSGQINSWRVLVILMTRFLLTNDILHWLFLLL